MVLINDPLRNEPSYENAPQELCDNYNEIIRFHNIWFSILKMIETPIQGYEVFMIHMIEYFLKNSNRYLEIVQKQVEKYSGKDIFISTGWNMSLKNPNYDMLYARMQDTVKALSLIHPDLAPPPATPGEALPPATPGEALPPATPGEALPPATPGEAPLPTPEVATVIPVTLETASAVPAGSDEPAGFLTPPIEKVPVQIHKMLKKDLENLAISKGIEIKKISELTGKMIPKTKSELISEILLK
jgi:hypothetical protein